LRKQTIERVSNNFVSYCRQKVSKSIFSSLEIGFSAVELLTAILIILILLAVSIRLFSTASHATTDAIAITLATRINETRRAALAGKLEVEKRTFRLANTRLKNSRGITVSTTLPTNRNVKSCLSNCPKSICFNNQVICYETANDFTFDQYSARKGQNHAFFVSNNTRTLAIIAEQSGNVRLLELINGEWQVRKF
jgi:Tfp pilus assembly protein FimT